MTHIQMEFMKKYNNQGLKRGMPKNPDHIPHSPPIFMYNAIEGKYE